MRIAQVAPLYESVPPKLYGGTERVVSYLSEELVAMGHDVTLFAACGSETTARLISTSTQSLRLSKDVTDPLAIHLNMIETVAEMASQFDVIHFHIDYLHFQISRRSPYPHITTLHGRLDIPELIRLHQTYSGMPLVSISDAQREPLTAVNWAATVLHGLPRALYSFNEQPDPYLLFLGRISPEKRLDRAIQIAELSGMPLKVAAKVDKADEDYFETTIRPLLKLAANVQFVGEVGESGKQDLIGNATALLFPVDWPEPFGLVMIEAMACGTPVIAFPCGSVPEIISHGQNGFIVSDVMSAVRAVGRLADISRRNCRRMFEERFTARRMASDYVKVYEQVIGAKRRGGSRGQSPEFFGKADAGEAAASVLLQ